MSQIKIVAPLLAATMLAAGMSAPAHAEGKADRARQAIAAAEAKLQTADSLGTAEAQPGETAQARAALAHAKENLAAGHKPEAIDDAIHASALADTAIGTMQKRKEQMADRTAADHAAAVADAQTQAAMAQQQADAANARADVATAAAQSSAADAAAAREAAAVATAAPQPATVQTTVTTQNAAKVPVRQTTVRKVTPRKVARHTTRTPVRTASASGSVTTTTTVTQ